MRTAFIPSSFHDDGGTIVPCRTDGQKSISPVRTLNRLHLSADSCSFSESCPTFCVLIVASASPFLESRVNAAFRGSRHQLSNHRMCVAFFKRGAVFFNETPASAARFPRDMFRDVQRVLSGTCLEIEKGDKSNFFTSSCVAVHVGAAWILNLDDEAWVQTYSRRLQNFNNRNYPLFSCSLFFLPIRCIRGHRLLLLIL